MKRKTKNPIMDIGSAGYVEVFRIQNSKGQGPYQDKNSPISRVLNQSLEPGMITMALASYGKMTSPVLCALFDVCARLDNPTGKIFRLPPNKDSFDPSDMTFMRKQKAVTGFANFEQFCSWFRSPAELRWLSENGYDLYKIKTRQVRIADLQCLFVPDGIGTKIEKLTREQEQIYKNFSIIDIRSFVIDTLEMNE